MLNQDTFLFFKLAVVLFFGMLAGAVVLQLSCGLFNRLTGARGGRAGSGAAGEVVPVPKTDAGWELYERIAALPGVPSPAFNRAMFIVFFATLVNGTGTFIIFHLLRMAGGATGYDFGGLLPVACVALPVGVVVLAGINGIMLPTHFGKGLMVSLLAHVLAAVLVAVVVLTALTLGLPVFTGFGT